MNLDWNSKPGCYALGAALALVVTTAMADPLTSQPSVPQTSLKLAIADSTETVTQGPDSTTLHGHRPMEAAAVRAAAQRPEALRRYLWRTRMIYNYYFWDFVKPE
jgi:hypothetical protein